MKLNTLVDCHVHCNYSDDCDVVPQAVIDEAINRGLHGLTFTDHYDIGFPDTAYDFSFDVAARSAYLCSLREKYKADIAIFVGIEIGIQPSVIDQSSAIIKDNHFDCVINSIHAVDGYALCMQGHYFKDKTKQQAYQRYLEAIYYSVCNLPDFDIVGHIGYICRYAPYADTSMPYAEYSDILDAIFKRVIQDGRAIEVNTSGYAYELGSTTPTIDLIKRYKELGGELITIGSDAHTTQRVGDDFTDAVRVIKDAGFETVVFFKERKPVCVPLNSL